MQKLKFGLPVSQKTQKLNFYFIFFFKIVKVNQKLPPRSSAPEAGLVGVKVLDKMGSGSLSTVIEGIQWRIENKEAFGIRVVNMSLGAAVTESYKNDPVCQAVEKAPGANIISLRAPGSMLDKKNRQSRVDNWYSGSARFNGTFR